MKKILIILAIALLPMQTMALDQIGDKELDNITARFGASAVGDAGALAAPPSDANSAANDFVPAVEPVSLGASTYDRISDASTVISDEATLTTFFVETNNVRIAAGLGLF